MRGRKKTRAPLKETLEAREPGKLLLDSGALELEAAAASPAQDAPSSPDAVEPVDLSPEQEQAPPVAAEVVGGNAVTAQEADPERVAYTMWNEGKVDEAIEFLERHLAAQRERRRETGLVEAPTVDPAHVEPASDWRERHRAALSAADFNAFGASVQTIDVTPNAADAILAQGATRSLRPTWLIALVLVAIGAVGATGLWIAGKDPEDVAAQAVAFLAEEPAPDLGATTAAQPRPLGDATSDPVAETDISVSPGEVGVGDAAAPDAAAAEPPPEEVETADIPTNDAEVADAAPLPSGVADIPSDVREAAGLPPAEPAPGQLLRVKDDEVAPADIASMPPHDETPIEDAAGAPATTASIETTDAAAPQPLAEVRLPRKRPEPPIGALIPPRSPSTIASVEPERRRAPVVVSPSELQVYSPVRRLPYPRVYNPYARPTLSPTEYQALLERRALAHDYAARRRAVAERRILFLDPR